MKKDVIVIGAGAAGMMCASEAGKRGRSVLILDHAKKLAEKIRISGGGRCNFTNREVKPENYLSHNPHFCRSALARFTPQDFLALIAKYKIAWHERDHGQLFCDDSAQQIIDLLQRECDQAGIEWRMGCHIEGVAKKDGAFKVSTDHGDFEAESLVIATGGLSIPKIGASPLGYRIAEQFGLKIVPVRPGLVPLTFQPQDFAHFTELSGISLDAVVRCNGTSFREAVLVTHRGLSGPAILQISNYWQPGETIGIDLLPDVDAAALLLEHQRDAALLTTVLAHHLPKRFVQQWCEGRVPVQPMNQYNTKQLKEIAAALHDWRLTPSGTLGYKKAEVTLGGVDTDELSSKTMEAKKVPGLYFIGEVVDITGWLGGFNFQWAWASGHAAGQFV
jgi:predicted Rossmann fold flavoprotein